MTRPVLLLAAAALLASTSPAAAQSRSEQEVRTAIKGKGGYGVAGCGLGAMAFGAEPGAIQVLAATINGICANQTFGITFGTSNCGPGILAEGTRNFVEANREVLAKDVARGGGETIGALTVLHGCADSHAVGAALQSRYDVIFPSATATDAQVTDAILGVLRSDPALGCARG
jgi:hypothetical protein